MAYLQTLTIRCKTDFVLFFSTLQRLVESSRGTGELLSGFDPNVSLDKESLAERLRYRWDFILNFDVAQHRDDALQLLDEELRKLQEGSNR